MTVQFAARAFGALRARWPPCLEPQPHCDCRPILQSGKEEGSGREMKPAPSGRGGAGGRETPLSLRGPPHTDTLANCFAELIAFWREVSAHDKLSKEAQGQELNEIAFLRGAWGSGRPSCRGSWGLPSFFSVRAPLLPGPSPSSELSGPWLVPCLVSFWFLCCIPEEPALPDLPPTLKPPQVPWGSK